MEIIDRSDIIIINPFGAEINPMTTHKGTYCNLANRTCQEGVCSECNVSLNMINVCCHCGHVGDDVVRRLVYIGGQGYVPSIECADRVACWQRYDKQKEAKQ